MASTVNPNKDFWAQASQTYNDVTTSRPWRHTIGRISMLARIPIYLIALGLQTVKVSFKAVCSPAVSFAAWAFNTHKLDSWTFSGVGKDGIVWVKLLDKIGSSAIGVIAAPPKQYLSFFETVKGSAKAVFLGSYHNPVEHKGQMVTLSCKQFAEGYFKTRPQYSKLFLENAYIGRNDVITAKLRSAIKAG
ncbi:MAG: hypothetical protein KFB93_06450 [Simkaniaceae bacterium]|jgi:hypothetical protein|nr:MAG: hypothetical protein KFB93_06450 [Simkaniaceae bacterium]